MKYMKYTNMRKFADDMQNAKLDIVASIDASLDHDLYGAGICRPYTFVEDW